MQTQDHFIADKVFPIVPVDKKSNKYFVYRKNDWFRDEAQRRADSTESAGSGYNLDTDSYSADVFAFHKDVGDQVLANADTPLAPLREASEFVTHRLLLRRELQFVTDYFTTGVWGTDVTGVASGPTAGQFTKWSVSGSTPIDDIEAAKEKMLSTTGMEANTLVLGYKTFRALKNHASITDRYKYTQAGAYVTEDLLAKLFGVDKVLVAKAVKATNNEGATGAYDFAFGASALLTHVAPTPGLLTPSAGYTFAWTGVSEGLGSTFGISQFRMEHLKATRVEGQVAFDNKVVAADLGYFFSTAA
jgi:hypothetical protein